MTAVRLSFFLGMLLAHPISLEADATPTPGSSQIPDLPPITDSTSTPTPKPTATPASDALPPIGGTPSPTPIPVPTPAPTAPPSPTLVPTTPTAPAETVSPSSSSTLIFTTPTPPPEELSNKKEEWFLEVLKGKNYGTLHQVSGQKGNEFVTERHEEAVVRREGYTLRTIDDLHLEEDSVGTVMSFTRNVTSPEGNGELEGVRSGDEITIHSPGAGDLTTQSGALSAIGPAAERRQRDAIPLVAGSKQSLQLFSLEHYGTPTPETLTVGSKVAHTLPDGTSQDLWPITVELKGDAEPKSTLWVNDSHEVICEEKNIPGLGLLTYGLSTKAVCSKPIEGIELFASALIRPDRSLKDTSRLGQVTYELSCPGLSTELPIWKGDPYTQEISKSEPGLTKFTVWMGSFAPEIAGYKIPLRNPSEALAPYLKSSRYLECDAPEIKQLAQEASGGSTNPVVIARSIETYVRYYISKKDLRLGFMTALDTARSREGDCKEHAVLCAAMGRSLGIPTRCVVGLCYVPPNEDLYANVSGDVSHGIFAFHMWAEAYVAPGLWMPMDAAMYGFDPGHIALVKTSLDEDEPDFESAISPIVGNLNIHILGTDLTNRPLPLPAPTADPRPTISRQLD